MKMIVAADENWAIGRNNELLVSIPNDMRHFRSVTTGHVIVMGRKTLESFPDGKPLKNRVNIVLSSNEQYDGHGAVVVHSLDELSRVLEKYDPDQVYCIGGGSLYEQLLPRTDTVYVTRIDHAYQADTYFPDLDRDEMWKVSEVSEEQTYFDLTYHFVTYVRVPVRTDEP